MNKYKLIAVDLDGTLLRSDGTVSAVNRKWIKKAEQAGALVCFATGRSRFTSKHLWEAVSPRSPMVVSNGAEVWSDHRTLLSRHTLPFAAVEQFYLLAARHGARFWITASSMDIHADTWDEHHREIKEWLKFGLSHRDPRVLGRLRRSIGQLGSFEVSASDPSNLEVTKKGVSKASGLAEVADLLKIERSEIAAIGDSFNDLEMIKWAGMGIAVNNAEEIVKESADLITGTNDEDGVAQAIQLILK